jgi:hypothetical protein
MTRVVRPIVGVDPQIRLSFGPIGPLRKAREFLLDLSRDRSTSISMGQPASRRVSGHRPTHS